MGYPLATHHRDPATSYAAEQRITQSGKRQTQTERVTEAVLRYPGRTSAELVALTGLDRHQVARRLPDAEKLGLVRQGAARMCSACRSMSVTWWPAAMDKQMRLF